MPRLEKSLLTLPNLAAVVNWTFVAVPIAVKPRLTRYLQLEKSG